MYTPEQLNTLFREMLGKRTGQQSQSTDKLKNKSGKPKSNFPDLSPAQILVIAGIVCGGLQLESVVVDKNQFVQIVLEGSLRRKTELEKIMEQIGSLPFDQVIKAMLGRY